MAATKIEWTERTWNPVTGCTKISKGCDHCYAEIMSRRLKAFGMKKYSKGFTVTTHEDILSEPLKWKKPSSIFVCSMSDLFHKDVPFEFIDKVLAIIRETKQHNFQILSKRAERMAQYFSKNSSPSNLWLGVTVECQEAKKRIDSLREIDATLRFLSVEPLIEDLGEVDLTGIGWVIVGGESGPKARPMKPEWALSLLNQAEREKIPFFFKQWGTFGSDGVRRNKKANGNIIDGRIVQKRPSEYKDL
ncbi:MAG: phage Gp37/Gp68 family protein [Deltaproteobacteria bacterium]|jgi:protein gp37|nr:phage Gp37/Gp68 family protein [Deltaproteobacteria bacterium]